MSDLILFLTGFCFPEMDIEEVVLNDVLRDSSECEVSVRLG